MRWAILALLVAAPLTAQDAATVTVQSPPARVDVDVSHATADTTVVLIDVSAAQASLDAAVATQGGDNWLTPIKRHWPWIALGAWAVWEFRRKSFASTTTVDDRDVTTVTWTEGPGGEHHHHPRGGHKGWDGHR